MPTILRAQKEDYPLLTQIGVPSFLAAHGHSATKEVVEAFMKANYSEAAFERELSNDQNIYHVLFHEQAPVGYAKILLNATHPDIAQPNVTKLERLYLLKEYFGLGLAQQLVQFNIEYARQFDQAGMWLHVWIENKRAVAFYKKMGFKVIGAYDFKLTDDHYNPNHHMYLEF